MSTIKHIRLINGDEIFGSVVLEEEHQTTVAMPLVATDTLSPDGREATALAPYIPFVELEHNFCILKNSTIITMSEVHPVVEDHYNLSLHYINKSNDNRLREIEEINQFMRESMLLNDLDDEDELISTALH